MGIFNIAYKVKNSSGNNVQPAAELAQSLKNEFEKFAAVKIHPLLHRSSFDIAYFDSRGNKTFPDESTTFKVGPPTREKSYTTPRGWTRYGLKVLGNFADDYWLYPFQDPKNWYRAFHGIGREKSQDFSQNAQLSDEQYASVNATTNIFFDHFRQAGSYLSGLARWALTTPMDPDHCKARNHHYGEGVYCSPNPDFPEQDGYVDTVSFDTKQGTKKYKCMLQVAVNPDGVKFTEDENIWVVPDPKDIRPYGILIKEVFDEKLFF
jgi:hypothetical protein